MRSAERRGYADALDLLGQAIERDPNYGPAMALAAHCQLTLHLAGWTNDEEVNRREGIDLARRAIRAAGNDAGTLARAAYVLGYFGEDLNAVLPLIERSLEINPSSADSWEKSGWRSSATLCGSPSSARIRVWLAGPSASMASRTSS